MLFSLPAPAICGMFLLMKKVGKEKAADSRRAVPSVDSVLKSENIPALTAQHGRQSVVAAVRKVLDGMRAEMQKLPAATPAAESEAVVKLVARELELSTQPFMRRVVNATGIILHTGLGRAVLPQPARDALLEVAGCCNLQTDLETGKRRPRETCIYDVVRQLVGAEMAVVVNNNAAATMLVLRALADGKEVVVSRGELIEIGGSFRLPDVMRESGAVLRDIGTTNKTHLRDYAAAIGPNAGMLLKVHRSNYRIVGFTDEVTVAQLAELGRKHKIPVVYDLGSGNLVDLTKFGVEAEPTIQEALRDGADIVLSSTDKLIGGPQGGMLVGRRDLLEKVRAHPLYRALRVDKLVLAALEATLKLFLAPEFLAERHPTFRMLAKTTDEMSAQARKLRDSLAGSKPGWQVSVGEDVDYVGGGTLPATKLPTVTVNITSDSLSADDIARLLRLARPPVIARIKDNAVVLDMRTVFPEELADIVGAASQMKC